MRIRDILNAAECKPLFNEVQAFVEESLSDYNKSIEENGFCYDDKDIFDFVWGTIEFSRAEICILDSPLLQRLRRIRQLGLASTVYCNADSSRFSHTIGVTEVASRMARVVKKKAGDVFNGEEFEEFKVFDIEEIVRLAAIFHDTGHMFYSHVSEVYFTFDNSFPRYSEITKAKSFFCEKTSSDASLHEMLGVMIVNSPQTIRLFELVAPYMKNSRMTNREHYLQLAEFISCLIIGSPTNKYILPYSTIINGAIDADKFDYLQRDSQCTKVPIAVDIARIIRKLYVVNIKEIEHSQIWEDSTSQTVPLRVMAIKNSARNVFFQLSNARSSMYESVYHHHKVLTAEMMFRSILRRIYSMKDCESISFTDILKLTDEAFNDYWKYTLIPELNVPEDKINEISQDLFDLKNRKLYKRVAAFSSDYLIAGKAAKEDFLNAIVQNPLSSDYDKFIRILNLEYTNVCSILGKKPQENPSFMFVYSKFDPMPSVPVERGDGYCIWSSKLMKQDTMEAGKKSKQEQYYLVTDCLERRPVYLALEKTLTFFDITGLKQEASICAKIQHSKLMDSRRILFEQDYYKDTLYILDDDFLLNKVYNKPLIEKILSKYQTYMGVNECLVTRTRLLKYLRQFLNFSIPYSEFIPLMNGVLYLISNATYLDRETIAKEFKNLFGHKLQEIQATGIHIVNLGGVFDSSTHLLYFLNDFKGKNSYVFDNSIEKALKNVKKDDYICFIDDGAYSGNQVVSIFQELMGIPMENRTTNEHHVNELSSEDKTRLKESKIALAYLFFNSNSECFIREHLEKLGIMDLSIIYNHNISSKIFEDKNFFDNEEQQDLVKKYLRKIGISILDSTKIKKNGEYKDRWDQDRIDKAALGYNDAQQAIVFNNNIPTYSITALWANGKPNGHNWEGLFQRTSKD